MMLGANTLYKVDIYVCTVMAVKSLRSLWIVSYMQDVLNAAKLPLIPSSSHGQALELSSNCILTASSLMRKCMTMIMLVHCLCMCACSRKAYHWSCNCLLAVANLVPSQSRRRQLLGLPTRYLQAYLLLTERLTASRNMPDQD